MTIGIIIISIIIILAIITIANYNSLVKLRQKTKNAWSQTEIQLQKRFDLIPNLVEIVKGYAKHESEVFKKIAELRTSWANSKTISEKSKLENEITESLKTLMAVVENFPELKANENFILLQSELSEMESKIAFSRQFYNDTVTMYNTKLEVFPSNIFASIFGFKEATLFQVESEEVKTNTKVQF